MALRCRIWKGTTTWTQKLLKNKFNPKPKKNQTQYLQLFQWYMLFYQWFFLSEGIDHRWFQTKLCATWFFYEYLNLFDHICKQQNMKETRIIKCKIEKQKWNLLLCCSFGPNDLGFSSHTPCELMFLPSLLLRYHNIYLLFFHLLN